MSTAELGTFYYVAQEWGVSIAPHFVCNQPQNSRSSSQPRFSQKKKTKKKKKMQFDIPTIIPKRVPYWCFHHSKSNKEVAYLFSFSIFMHILFPQVDIENFVSLTCTYTLTFRVLKWRESVYPPWTMLFITPKPLEVLRWNFGLGDKLSLGIVWGQS